ncbi:MAG: acetyl-CoA carboxylase, biotin carboxyl carrier protein [Holosporales bacterium]|jgi:acetyl-CoA carboxylase biotin carboxyl carrier protein|nr:acetyl-CoA carboxylase, biotin carboxyl carrier protein [Holosporales bacterium]
MPRFEINEAVFDRLAEILKRHSLRELEYHEGNVKIKIVAAVRHENFYMPASNNLQVDTTQSKTETARLDEKSDNYAGHPGAITSPMVGTCYLSPEPGAKNFVAVGDIVHEGQPILIVEAMKVMNLIKAPKSGKVIHIAVSNAAPVEFGQLLLVIEQS